jgi:hypothetical protein
MTAQPVDTPDPETQSGVKDELTPERPAAAGTTRGKTRPSRRRTSAVENPDYAAFAARIICAHGRRIADGDIDALPDLIALAAQLDTATQHAVNGLRTFGYSWGDIASRLGTTRQAAQQRWGH